MRNLDTGVGETRWIQLADLHQNRSLIPIDMLARKLSVSELRDYDDWDFDRPARGWESRQQVVDDACMGELGDHLIDDRICPGRVAHRKGRCHHT